MTHLKGDIWVPVGQHRLYPYFSNLLILTACINKALAITANVPVIYKPGDFSYFNSRQFPLRVILPLYGPIELALQQQEAHVIQVRIEPGKPNANFGLGLKHEVSNSIFLDTIIPVFTTFFEDNVEWLKRNVDRDKTKWPGVIGFSRVVRNAISHGRSINIDDPKATPVKWHNLSYGWPENTRKIFGPDLIFGDLMILMFELSEELDKRGCPI